MANFTDDQLLCICGLARASMQRIVDEIAQDALAWRDAHPNGYDPQWAICDGPEDEGRDRRYAAYADLAQLYQAAGGIDIEIHTRERFDAAIESQIGALLRSGYAAGRHDPRNAWEREWDVMV